MPQDAKVFIIFWRRLFYGSKYHLKFYLSYLFFCFLLCSLYLIFSVELLLLTLRSLMNSTILIILKSVSPAQNLFLNLRSISLTWMFCQHCKSNKPIHYTSYCPPKIHYFKNWINYIVYEVIIDTEKYQARQGKRWYQGTRVIIAIKEYL